MSESAPRAKPRALETGDLLRVVAPASPFEREVFDRGVAELERLGFRTRHEAEVFARRHHLAGDAETRARALNEGWRDPDVAGLIAVRGGSGSAQVLPLVRDGFGRAPVKAFVGCSDLTALLTYLTLGCGTVGFHGPMLVNLAQGEAGYDRETLLGALTSREPLGTLTPPGLDALRPGQARGILLGGTLSLILASLGTPAAFDPPEGFVLLLDEIGERPYRLDRMLTQLGQAGLLARASAVVCAELPDCAGPSGPDPRALIADRLRSFGGPVLFGFPTGHTAGPVWTLPLGVPVSVVTTPRPALVVEEAAVA